MTMVGWLVRLFLVKQIESRKGDLHFQRFRLLATPWFSVFVHRILASDEDRHLHDHPWSFVSLILWGSYTELCARSPHWGSPKSRKVRPGNLVVHHHSDAHKLTLNTKVVWSLVIAGRREALWGYQTEDGWVDHYLYRLRKGAGRY